MSEMTNLEEARWLASELFTAITLAQINNEPVLVPNEVMEHLEDNKPSWLGE